MESWYTIKEFAKLHGMNLKFKTRIALGDNALKIERDLKNPIDKRYKWEKGTFKRRCGNTKKGVRIWPEWILKEIFFSKV